MGLCAVQTWVICLRSIVAHQAIASARSRRTVRSLMPLAFAIRARVHPLRRIRWQRCWRLSVTYSRRTTGSVNSSSRKAVVVVIIVPGERALGVLTSHELQ